MQGWTKGGELDGRAVGGTGFLVFFVGYIAVSNRFLVVSFFLGFGIIPFVPR